MLVVLGLGLSRLQLWGRRQEMSILLRLLL